MKPLLSYLDTFIYNLDSKLLGRPKTLDLNTVLVT